MSQILSVLSLDEVNIVLMSGLNCAERISAKCPFKSTNNFPEAASQILQVRSSDIEFAQCFGIDGFAINDTFSEIGYPALVF